MFAPHTASALIETSDCSSELEQCADSAISTYDTCICNVDSGGEGCFKQFAKAPAPAPGSSSSVAECDASLQGDLFKCQATDAICTLTSGKSGAPGGIPLKQ